MGSWIASLLGLVEGATEFLPVSSTGHLILFGRLFNWDGDAAKTFEVFIQLGAILAVVLVYRKRFLGLLNFTSASGLTGVRGLSLLALTTVPAAVVGLLAHGMIKERLFEPMPVALALGVGGAAILIVERIRPQARLEGLDALTWREALAIGLFQCLALWPGISRSAATILGAMLIGVERRTAAEYSFFAAVPVLTAAGLYDLYRNWSCLTSCDLAPFTVGFAVAFISGWFAIRYFIRFLSHHTLAPFGWYRLVLAVLVAALLWR